jgi:hypothetical protein
MRRHIRPYVEMSKPLLGLENSPVSSIDIPDARGAFQALKHAVQEHF